MKKFLFIALCIALSVVPPAAEASMLDKPIHYVKKALWFPVYLIGGSIAGAGTGVVAWYILADNGYAAKIKKAAEELQKQQAAQ